METVSQIPERFERPLTDSSSRAIERAASTHMAAKYRPTSQAPSVGSQTALSTALGQVELHRAVPTAHRVADEPYLVLVPSLGRADAPQRDRDDLVACH